MSVSVTQTAIQIREKGIRGRPGLLAAANSPESLAALQPGLGDDGLAITPDGLGDVMEALGVMLNRMHRLRPTKAKPFAAMRVSTDRWWVSTFVVGGNRMDYAIHEFVNRGAAMSPAIESCWAYNGCVAWIDGLFEEFANFTGENTGAGIMDSLTPPSWESGVRIGPYSTHPTGYDYVAPAHGHLQNPGCGIFLNGSAAVNYRDPENAPIGVVLRGTAFSFNQTFDAYLPDNTTPAGAYALAHIMVEGGVTIASTFGCTGTNIGMTTAMGMGLSGRGDMLKVGGVATPIAADREDGLEYGLGGVLNASLGENTVFQLYNDSRPDRFLRATLGGGGPVAIDGGAYGWSGNLTNRDSWLQDRTDGYAKVYAPGVNRATSDGALLVDGKEFAFNVTYQVCKGTLA